jgi:anti-sigma regulatory factor (Ser/Thr protein kinase)
MLAEIGAPNPPGDSLRDVTDPRVANGDVHVCVGCHGRDDVFPLLKAALLERFASVPRPDLIRDVLVPLKNALGNACKHGNRRDPAKRISVELTLTRQGALIAITDEGPGFNAARTFRRFQSQETYFVNHGSGFRNLHRAKSTVSYENDGRTLLLCYRPAAQSEDQPAPFPAAVRNSGPGSPPPKIVDPEWIRTAALAGFAGGPSEIESCRVYATHGRAGDDCGNRYVLRVAGRHGQPPAMRTLTGRLHAAEADAEADFAAATRLREARISERVRIPRPVARPAGEPRLVLYEFDPWMNLWEYLNYRESLNSLRHSAERIGQTLAGLHRSRVAFTGGTDDSAGMDLSAMLARVATKLETQNAPRDLVDRFHSLVQRLHERELHGQPQRLVPIHGGFGWDCIHYGVDARFYLFRFEKCRQSYPGFDLGGYAADLLCFTLAAHDERAYRACTEILLNNYNTTAAHPVSADDLRSYVVLALAERLQRQAPDIETGGDRQLLAALDSALTEQKRHVASSAAHDKFSPAAKTVSRFPRGARIAGAKKFRRGIFAH